MIHARLRLSSAMLIVVVGSSARIFAESSEATPDDNALTFQRALYSGSVGHLFSGRSAVAADSSWQRVVADDLTPPTESEASGTNFRGEEQYWREIVVDESGTIAGDPIRGGRLYLTCNVGSDQTAILQANGVSDVVVNGVPRAGDVYGKGWAILPLKLRQGSNEFWMKVARGRNKSLKLSIPPKPVYLTAVDATLPDFLTTQTDKKWAAVRVVNASETTLDQLKIRAVANELSETTEDLGAVTPMTTRKLAFLVQDDADELGEQTVQVSLLRQGEVIDEIALTIEVKSPEQNFRRTFVSNIDGSVQYYGVRQGVAQEGRKPALFLSLHGAGVKAIGQAGAYQAKDWGHVIAPTNRREFGFDWEDWGRLDALEALADAELTYDFDPQRNYLTGHSMGGHGTWHLGATYACRWAAIAPMAGWRSFFTYARGRSDEEPHGMRRMTDRAANPSRTPELLRNYLQHGVFIEHGSSDQTVPVREARAMRSELAAFHPDFTYYEELGGGHWYGVDHARVFEFFRRSEKKDVRDVDRLEFRIASPGIASTCRYITLYQQEESYEFCGVVAQQSIRSRRQRRRNEDISGRDFDITTENLAQFRIDLAHCKGLERVSLEVDGQSIEELPWPDEEAVWLKKIDGAWTVVERPTALAEKNPQRYGGFKDAFRHKMLFVYSTLGGDEENAWSYNKARFDAEAFYYRGNGSIDVIPDSQFTLKTYPDRSVIVYGNANTNAAWEPLLKNCPVQVRRGEIVIGDRVLNGRDLGVYMVRPRSDSAVASVGVVAGTGSRGFQAAYPNRYFVAGTGYPDLMVFSPQLYTDGLDGLKAVGYFGNDWSVENGSIAWFDDGAGGP